MPRLLAARAGKLALFVMFSIAACACAHDASVRTASVCGNVFEVVHGTKKNVARAYVFVSDKTGHGERHPLDAKGRYAATGLTAGPITVLAQVAGGSTITCTVAAGASAQLDMRVTRNDVKIRKLSTCPAPAKTSDCIEIQNG